MHDVLDVGEINDVLSVTIERREEVRGRTRQKEVVEVKENERDEDNEEEIEDMQWEEVIS